MRCIRFKGFLSKGATRPFLAKTEQENVYVVKAHGNPLGTKALFNEYIAGLLAKEIGLAWPDVRIVRLSHEIIEILNQNDFKILSEWAVGIKYIEGLKEITWPENVNYSDPNFAERNAQYLMSLFPDLKTHDAFYGKAVFDNWILLGDTTYDTLHKSAEGHPVFLDASIALGGLEWDENKLKWTMVIPDRSIYLVGYVSDLSKFVPWIDKVKRIGSANIEKILGEIPKDWNVPNNYIISISEFLASTDDDFLPMFQEWIEFEKGIFVDTT